MGILTKEERHQSWMELTESAIDLADKISSYDWTLRSTEPGELQEQYDHIMRQRAMLSSAQAMSEDLERARAEAERARPINPYAAPEVDF